MEVNFIKIAGGVLVPCSQLEVQRMQRFPNGEVFPVTIKLPINGPFHGKVFVFFNYCFERWNAEKNYPFMNEVAQFKAFRNQMTILAGYYDQVWNLDETFKLEAKSLSYDSMSQEEKESLAYALSDVAAKSIFKNESKEVFMKLISFFDLK